MQLSMACLPRKLADVCGDIRMNTLLFAAIGLCRHPDVVAGQAARAVGA
jgi:hypothetical protein